MNANRKLKPSAVPPRPLSPRVAWGLGALVLGVHLWLLSGHLTVSVHPQPPHSAPLSFSTRRIEAAPAQPAAVTSPSKAISKATSKTGPSATASRPPPASVPVTSAATLPSGAPAQAQAPTPSDPVPAVPTPPPAEAAQARAEEEATPASPAALPPDTPTVDTPPAEGSAQAAAPHLPGSARLRYELNGRSRGLSYSADGELTWQQDGQRYEARMLISGLLLVRPRVMSSTGELGPDGVVPRRFSDKTRTEQATHFQPERGRILFSSNAPEAPWQPGAQDRVSLFFQLAGLLAAEPSRYTQGTQLKLLTAGTREADLWTFTVMGAPTLALPIGEQATIALKREPRREHDQTIEIWFAPALGYLPARIRITQANGDVIDQRLAALEPL